MTTESKAPILKDAAHVPPEGRSRKIRIRLRREDAAYVYAILEANGGLTAYSTLEHGPGERHRDLELVVPIGFVDEVNSLIEELRRELRAEGTGAPGAAEGEQLYVIPLEPETS